MGQSAEMIADVMTKPLPAPQHRALIKLMMGGHAWVARGSVKSTQALAHVASSRIVVYTVSRWDRAQYLMSYSTVQYSTVRYGTVRYSTVP